MKYKRIYIEIINYCNLNCHFCIKTKKESRVMTISEFKIIINKIKEYTDYIYLHIQGEPLLNPNINTFLDIARDNNLFVQLTTNATLIKNNLNILHHTAIRQINLSLQAVENLPNKDEIYQDIVTLIKTKNNPFISLRIWGNFNDMVTNKIITYFEDKLNTKYNPQIHEIAKGVFISKDDEFTWPSLDNPVNPINSSCIALSTQLGILVDGTIVPCCLDKDGIIDLGNIFDEKVTINSIINSLRYQNMIESFKNNKSSEELCKRCTFR